MSETDKTDEVRIELLKSAPQGFSYSKKDLESMVYEGQMPQEKTNNKKTLLLGALTLMGATVTWIGVKENFGVDTANIMAATCAVGELGLIGVLSLAVGSVRNRARRVKEQVIRDAIYDAGVDRKRSKIQPGQYADQQLKDQVQKISRDVRKGGSDAMERIHERANRTELARHYDSRTNPEAIWDALDAAENNTRR